jgi:hypothetical protein
MNDETPKPNLPSEARLPELRSERRKEGTLRLVKLVKTQVCGPKGLTQHNKTEEAPSKRGRSSGQQAQSGRNTEGRGGKAFRLD